MRASIESFINWSTYPPILLTAILLVFFIVFPPTARLHRLHRRMRLHLLWSRTSAVVFFVLLTAMLAFGLRDPNFRLLVLKPDNVPIVGLLYLMPFFLWLSMRQAVANDARLDEGKKPNEYHDPDDQVLVWPDLMLVELITTLLTVVGLVAWSLAVPAPLEEPANPTISPNPSKAPWYFLGLQELLVYFDPWIAGVMVPAVMILALMAIPYIDTNPRGQGYYSFKQRKLAISLFLFCFLVLWLFLIFVGTFLRGPNWSFFGPFEPWDAQKFVTHPNINLSEYFYIILLGRPLPDSPFAREALGLIVIGGYFLVLPALLAMTVLKHVYRRLEAFRYSVFVFIALVMFALPIKMYLRWLFNLKYLLALPEFNLNI
jgi:hypothetical protein